MSLKDVISTPDIQLPEAMTQKDVDLYNSVRNKLIEIDLAFKTLQDNTASGYTTPTNLTTVRTFDADATTLAELADVVGTLIEDLKAKGIIEA